METSINKIIQLERIRYGKTQSELAKACYMDASRLSDIERGTKSPTWTDLERISEALGCKLFELLPKQVLQEHHSQIVENKESISNNRQEIKKIWEAIDELKKV